MVHEQTFFCVTELIGGSLVQLFLWYASINVHPMRGCVRMLLLMKGTFVPFAKTASWAWWRIQWYKTTEGFLPPTITYLKCSFHHKCSFHYCSGTLVTMQQSSPKSITNQQSTPVSAKNGCLLGWNCYLPSTKLGEAGANGEVCFHHLKLFCHAVQHGTAAYHLHFFEAYWVQELLHFIGAGTLHHSLYELPEENDSNIVVVNPPAKTDNCVF